MVKEVNISNIDSEEEIGDEEEPRIGSADFAKYKNPTMPIESVKIVDENKPGMFK